MTASGAACLAAGANASACIAARLVGGGSLAPALLAAGLVAAWVLAESDAQRRFADSPARRERTTPSAVGFGIAVLTVLLLAGLAPFGAVLPLHLHLALAAAGTLAAAAGIALRCASIAALGPFFHDDTELSPAQHRVRSGVYAYLDHPSELGTLLIAFGIAAINLSPAAAAVTVLVLLPLALVRTRREDLLLRSLTNT